MSATEEETVRMKWAEAFASFQVRSQTHKRLLAVEYWAKRRPHCIGLLGGSSNWWDEPDVRLATNAFLTEKKEREKILLAARLEYESHFGMMCSTSMPEYGIYGGR